MPEPTQGAESHQASSSPGPNRDGPPRARTQGSPSLTKSIAHVTVIKEEDLYFVAERDGRVPVAEMHGLGLYYHDCRYLNGYDLRLADAEPLVAASTVVRGFQAVFELTNQAIVLADGGSIPKETVGIRWSRLIDHERHALHDRLRFQN
jgi:glycogen debranching enzyme